MPVTIFYNTDTMSIVSTTHSSVKKLPTRMKKLGLAMVTTNQQYSQAWKSIMVDSDGGLIGFNNTMFSGIRVATTFDKPEALGLDWKPYLQSVTPQPNQHKIGVVRMVGAGDVLMVGQVLLPSVRRQFPGSHVTMYTSDIGARLLLGNSNIDRLVSLDWKHAPYGKVKLPEQVQANSIVNLVNQVDFLPDVLMCDRPANFLRVGTQQLGLESMNKVVEFPQVFYSHHSSIWTEHLMEYNNIVPPFIGCQLSSHGSCRYWPVDKWIRLAEMCPGYTFIWFSDNPIHQIIKNVPGNVVNTANQLNFEEYITLWRFCDVTICPDSGGMHLSGCANQPCIVLAGSTKIEDHIPHYKSVAVIKTKEKLPCTPCFDWQVRHDCKGKGDPWCTDTIQVIDVFDEIQSHLSNLAEQFNY